MYEKGKIEKNQSSLYFIVTRNPNWFLEILGKGLFMK
jgi:hypothetical protein